MLARVTPRQNRASTRSSRTATPGCRRFLIFPTRLVMLASQRRPIRVSDESSHHSGFLEYGGGGRISPPVVPIRVVLDFPHFDCRDRRGSVGASIRSA